MKDKHKYFYCVIKEKVRNISKRIIKNLSNEKLNSNEVTMIISIDFTRSVYFVYSMSGILLNRVDFKEMVEQFGRVEQISENGKNMIFLDERDKFKIPHAHILCLNSSQLIYIKSIHIYDDITNYIGQVMKF